MYKLFVIATLLTVATAGEYQATSFSSFNNEHNSVEHLAAPALVKYAAPVATVAKVALPAAPVYPATTFAKFVAPASPLYSAPVVTKYAAPAVTKVALPLAPVTKYVAAPSYPSHYEESAPAKYEYAYGIQDSHTGDYHSQQEQRDGDHVVGQYSLHEADGTVRIVKYSDDGHGFNAVVEKQGHPTETVLKKVVSVAAPLYHH